MGRTSDARERLIRAALDLVLRESYPAATVDAICKAAQVKKGSFYHFFPSREDLMIAVLDADWAELKPHYDRVFSPALPPLERLRQYCRLVLGRQTRERTRLGCVIGCILMRVGSSLGPDESRVRDKVRELSAVALRYFESAIRDGQANGSLRAGPPARLARLMLDHLEGVLATARLLEDLSSIEELEGRIIDLLAVPVPVR